MRSIERKARHAFASHPAHHLNPHLILTFKIEDQNPQIKTCQLPECLYVVRPYFMKDKIHPKYVESEIRCACGNVIKTRSTKPTMLVGICNVCHPFYTGTQKFIDTAGRVDKFQQRMVKTQAAQAAAAASKKKKK
jgi:large subunit ribosomal protein L31